MTKEKQMIKELYKALNTNTTDLINATKKGIMTSSHLRCFNCVKLLNEWVKKHKMQKEFEGLKKK